MDQSPTPLQIQTPMQKKGHTFKIIVIVGLLIAGALIAWLSFRVDDLSKKVDSQAATLQQQDEEEEKRVETTTITSGQQGFSVSVPDGWGPLVNVMDSDRLTLKGTQQPTVKGGAETEVIEVEAEGSDNASLFTIMLTDGDVSARTGEASEFNIGKAEEELKGTKYIYEYPEDTLVGIGYLRLKGDRDYSYVFPAEDGKTLYVMYNVYGSDPRNQIETVDGIVQSIRLKQ